MKTAFIALLISVAASSMSLACPDFSGEYVIRRETSETTEMRSRIVQNGCSKITISTAEFKNGEKLKDLPRSFVLFPDGVSRPEPYGFKSTAKAYFKNEELVYEREPGAKEHSPQRHVITYSHNKKGGINFLMEITFLEDNTTASNAYVWERR
jgi:hypothetical protein